MCKADAAMFLTGYFVRVGLLVMGTAGSPVSVLDPQCMGETPATTGMAETWGNLVENPGLDLQEILMMSATGVQMEELKRLEMLLIGRWDLHFFWNDRV